jgi:hypothetical protein
MHPRLGKFLMTIALVGANAAFAAVALAESHPKGGCVYWEAEGHCSCEQSEPLENCHLDSDCNWSICGEN